jgi:hypothetical protein
MAVPNIFGTATSAIPLSQLDTNFATPVTIGNTAVQLGNTVTSFGNVTLTNVTISSGNVTIAGANISGTANVSTLVVTGNQSFVGTGNRITGDMSNATVANRLGFQTSTSNANTVIPFSPNGTGNNAGILLYNNSDLANASRIDFRITATEASYTSTFLGTGTYLPMTFYTGGSERVRIVGGTGSDVGFVGIGTATPKMKLNAEGTYGNPVTSGATPTGIARFSQTTNNVTLDFGVSTGNAAWLQGADKANLAGTYDISINPVGGLLLVGTLSTAAPTASTGDIVAGGLALNPSRRTTASAGNTFWSSADGFYYRSTSSLRYKINVQDYGKGLIDIAKLRPVKFNSKPKEGEKNPDTHTYAGFIAEEVHDAGLIEFVTYAKDGSPDALSYANMVALLTKAIQEQQALITALTNRITALEAK